MLTQKLKARIKPHLAYLVRQFYLRFPPFPDPFFPGSRLLKDRPDLASDEIGDYTWGQLTVSNRGTGCKLRIGKFCSFAYNSKVLLGGEHRMEWLTTSRFATYSPIRERLGSSVFDHPTTHKGDVVIGNDVWVGQDAMILSGVTIGDGAIVGAGSVVRRSFPPYAIIAGNPAGIAGYRFDQKVIAQLLEIAWWDWPLEKILGSLPLLYSSDVGAFVARYGGTVVAAPGTQEAPG